MNVLLLIVALAGWAAAAVCFAVLCLVARNAVRLEAELKAWTGAKPSMPVGRFGEHES